MAVASSNRNLAPQVNGQDASLDQAIQAAAKLLRTSKFPLLTGTPVAVNTSRQMIHLARRINAAIDYTFSEPAFANLLAMQRVGMVTASMAEVRFRADCIGLLGDDSLLVQFPRIRERILFQSDESLGVASKRSILLIGAWSESSMQLFGQLEVERVDVPLFDSPRSLFAHPRIQERLRLSTYAAFVWSTSALQLRDGDLWVERLLRSILARNELNRCVGLPLGGSDVTFQQVCTWLTGFPGRIRFLGDDVVYDPYQYQAQVLIDQNRIDCQVVVQEAILPLVNQCRADFARQAVGDISQRSMQPQASPFTILLSATDPLRDNVPSVFIPTTLPGVEADEILFPSDSVAAKYYPAQVQSNRPTASQVMTQLQREL